MISRIVSAISISMLAVSCAADPSMGYPDGDGEPTRDTAPLVTQDDIDRSLRVGGRVLVLHQKIKSKICPVKIRTLDNLCQGKHFQNSDPALICRRLAPGIGIPGDPNDPNNEPENNRIIWTSMDPNAKFTVHIESNLKPCGGPQDWTGPREALARHECELSSAADLKLNHGEKLYIKYTIKSENPGECADLDPFFIVRH